MGRAVCPHTCQRGEPGRCQAPLEPGHGEGGGAREGGGADPVQRLARVPHITLVVCQVSRVVCLPRSLRCALARLPAVPCVQTLRTEDRLRLLLQHLHTVRFVPRAQVRRREGGVRREVASKTSRGSASCPRDAGSAAVGKVMAGSPRRHDTLIFGPCLGLGRAVDSLLEAVDRLVTARPRQQPELAAAPRAHEPRSCPLPEPETSRPTP